MNRNRYGVNPQPHPHPGHHRQIGLRAVAAAVLYQDGSAEHAVDRDVTRDMIRDMTRGMLSDMASDLPPPAGSRGR